jgi:hypothetical protein
MMTHEVWLMMLGLNLDLWTQPLVEKAVAKFGKLLVWEEDHYHMARAIVKVRVASLEEIPWFFIFTEGTNFESDSWSVQCEILQTNMLGGAPQDEDFPPDDDDFYPHNFFYLGYGQVGAGSTTTAPQAHNPTNAECLDALGCGIWPAQQQQQHQVQNDEGGNVDEAPALIPMKPVENQAVENQTVAQEEVILAPVEPAVATPPLNEELNLPHFQEEETQEEDLLGFVQPHEEQLHELPADAQENVQLNAYDPVHAQNNVQLNDNDHGPTQNNVQIGMVQTFLPDVDPILGGLLTNKQTPIASVGLGLDGLSSAAASPSPATFRMWAKYFSSADPGLPTVTIPREWMDFFTLLLLKQSSSEWATEFLQSPAWTLLNQSAFGNHLSSGNSFTFTLPKSPPSVNLADLSCSNRSSKPRSSVIISELLSDEDAEMNPSSFSMEGSMDPRSHLDLQSSQPRVDSPILPPSVIVDTLAAFDSSPPATSVDPLLKPTSFPYTSEERH